MSAETGIRSKAEWVMMMASQSPVAQRATNSLRRSVLVSSPVGHEHFGVGVELERTRG